MSKVSKKVVDEFGRQMIKNPPTVKMMDSLQHSDYTPSFACAEMIDNSIVADADRIFITLERGKRGPNGDLNRIIISDNGNGMNKEILIEALCFGSRSEYKPKSLSKFGIGLSMASLALGGVLSVVTKAEGGVCYFGKQDLNTCKTLDGYYQLIAEANKNEEKIWKKYVIDMQKDNPVYNGKGNPIPVRKSGTVVIISDINKELNVDDLVLAFLRDLSSIYCELIKDKNIHIYVQQKEIKSDHPINDYKHKVLFEDQVKLKDGVVGVKVALIDNNSKSKKGKTSKNGFFIFRNGRLIDGGRTHKFFMRDECYNNLRIQLNIDENLDKAFGTTCEKHGVSMQPSVVSKLKEVLMPYINKVRKEYESKSKSKNKERMQKQLDELAKRINAKSPQLWFPSILGRSNKVKPGNVTHGKRKSKHKASDTELYKQIMKKIEKERNRSKVKNATQLLFHLRNEGCPDKFMSPETLDRNIIININEAAPYYENCLSKISKSKEEKFMYDLIGAVGMSLVTADPDSKEAAIVKNILDSIGYNLSVLANDD